MNTNISGDTKTSPVAQVTANSIEDSIEELLKKLEALPKNERKEKNKDIKSMIAYYDDITTNIEERRAQIAEFSWQSIAVFVTAFGIIVALDIIALVKIPILIILTEFFVFSILKIREFNFQSAFRYPFLDIKQFGNQWKWFYYGNKFLLKINPDISKIKKTRIDDQSHYLEGLEFFLSRYVEEKEEDELKENVLQLYLLQVHNYYKNRFYLNLLKYDQYTTLVVAYTIILYLVIAVILIVFSPTIKDFLLTKSF